MLGFGTHSRASDYPSLWVCVIVDNIYNGRHEGKTITESKIIFLEMSQLPGIVLVEEN